MTVPKNQLQYGIKFLTFRPGFSSLHWIETRLIGQEIYNRFETENIAVEDPRLEKRSASRAVPTGFSAAEIKLTGIPLYQFKLKDISDNGASILVKENSAMIDHLKVGQTLEIKFHSDSQKELNGYFDAQIKHISKTEGGRYKGHYLIGVSLSAK